MMKQKPSLSVMTLCESVSDEGRKIELAFALPLPQACTAFCGSSCPRLLHASRHCGKVLRPLSHSYLAFLISYLKWNSFQNYAYVWPRHVRSCTVNCSVSNTL